jgi:DNA-binding NtrC family response regulator
MASLHIRLVTGEPDREDVKALAAALRAAGHVVLTSADAPVPLHVSPAPDFVISEGSSQPVPESLDAAESRHIRAVLEYTGNNRRQAALLLGVARSTLLAKIRKYGL